MKGFVSFIDPCCDDIPAALLGKILEAISNVEKEWNSRFTNDINSFPPDIIYDEPILNTKDIFEQTMLSCGYVIDKIIQYEDSQEVRKVEGRVKIPKKVTIFGNRQTIIEEKKFRWDAVGRCFSLRSNTRQRRYDLPLQTIVEFNKLKETEKEML